ncbi:L-threonylcarbamoyladenylate synthase [Sungkyunkwania multivorans]|uniref:L-threonylcarbamoyladenylate synthase n=1 Tax=Sungkyunkwania multivorans TaxID=1173618 RepID=A0ABW3CU95_9FLAO
MKEAIETALRHLKQGDTILYPTDTVWGLGCDATDAAAVSSIYKIKRRDDSKALICLVSDVRMLQRYVQEVPAIAFDILKSTTKPTTIIYDNPRGIAKNLVAADNTLAIRIVKDEFCRHLIDKLQRPLVSTSANISGDPAPQNFKEIDPDIINSVDHVVDLHRDKVGGNPSTIIKLTNDGEVKILRK